MLPQALQQAALPAVALAAQRRPVGRHLGPADRIGEEDDAGAAALLAGPPVQPRHQLHVLADGVAAEAAGPHRRLLAEQAEGAGDDQQRVHPRQRRAAGEKAAHVLLRLAQQQRPARRGGVQHPAAPHRRLVEHPDDAARGDHPVVLGEGAGDAQQGIGLEQRIGVDGAEQREAGGVDAGVEGVALAAALLVEHGQVGVASRHPGAPYGAAGQPLLVRGRHRRQAEAAPQPLERVVGRAVVDQHDLELGVAQLEQRAQVLDHRRRLVVRRHQDRDRRVGAVGEQRPVLAVRPAPPVGEQVEKGDRREDQVDRVEGQEVAQDQGLEPEQHRVGGHQLATASSPAAGAGAVSARRSSSGIAARRARP